MLLSNGCQRKGGTASNGDLSWGDFYFCGHFLFLFLLLGLPILELGWISELGYRVKSFRVLGFSRWRRGTQFTLWQHHLVVLLILVLMCRESQWTPFGQEFFLLLALWRISAWIHRVIAGSIFTKWLQYCKEATAAAEWAIIAKDREVSSFGLFHSIAAPRISKGLNSH
jgi:hypothetical protein